MRRPVLPMGANLECHQLTALLITSHVGIQVQGHDAVPTTAGVPIQIATAEQGITNLKTKQNLLTQKGASC